MSDVLMRASRRDKKRIEQDKLPQKSETPVKKVRDLDTSGIPKEIPDERWNTETRKK
jgi:hypothetical protein